MSTFELVFAIALGSVAGVALSGLIVFMACALWGADRISYLRSTLVALLHAAVLAPVAWGALSLVSDAGPAGWMDPQTQLTASPILLPVSLAALVGLLRALEAVPVRFGVVIWIFNLLLHLLFAALIGGIVFVGLAIYQVTRDTVGRDMLIQGGLIFAGVVGLLALLILGMGALRSRPR